MKKKIIILLTLIMSLCLALASFTACKENDEDVVEVKKFDVTISSSNSDYGTVDVTLIEDVEEGTIITVNENVLTIGETVVTATVKVDTAKMDYNFVGFTGVEESVESDLAITANFTATEIPAVLSLSKTIIDSYEFGKTIEIPAGSMYNEACAVSVSAPDGSAVTIADNKLTLAQEGVYTITYTLESDASVSKEVKVRSVANLGYISSSDGAVTNSTVYTFIYANGFNKDTTLTVNNIVDVSGAKFASNFLITQVNFGAINDISSMFGNYVVKVTDYKDPTNYITITLSSPMAEKMNAYVKHSSADEDALIEGVYFEGGMNIFFDYADKKVAIGATGNAASIAGFEGFTDGRCIVSMYALDWATGVESVNLGFDWVFDNRNYTVNIEDYYTTITQAPEQTAGITLSRVMMDSYEKGKTLVLPTANAACDIVVKDPDGSPVVITDNKLLLSKTGEYTVTYTLSSDTGITKVLKIRSVENLSYVSSNDGSVNATSDASYIYANGYKKGTVLTVNKIIDASSASFASAYVIVAPAVADGATSINNLFGGITIKLTDYKNADNYITITMQTPTDTKCIATVKVSGSETVYTAGGESGKNFAGGANIFFDYADKKVSIGDRDDFAVIEEFEGFTDGKCIMTIYAEEWADGVESADIKFGYITDSRNYTVDLNDFYAD